MPLGSHSFVMAVGIAAPGIYGDDAGGMGECDEEQKFKEPISDNRSGVQGEACNVLASTLRN